MSIKFLIAFICLIEGLVEVHSFGSDRLLLNPETIEFGRNEHAHYSPHLRRYLYQRIDSDVGQRPAPPPPLHNDQSKISEMFQSLLNQEINKSGEIEATNNLVMAAEVKGKAVVQSKSMTKLTETIIDKNHNNDSKLITRNLDQTGETNSVIDFSKGAEIQNSKKVEVHTNEEIKPRQEKISGLPQTFDMPVTRPGIVPFNSKDGLAHGLNRIKREDEENMGTTGQPEKRRKKGGKRGGQKRGGQKKGGQKRGGQRKRQNQKKKQKPTSAPDTASTA